MKYLKKRTVVDAHQNATNLFPKTHTPEGLVTARPGDWIVTNHNGDTHVLSPEIFESTYEPVSEDSQ